MSDKEGSSNPTILEMEEKEIPEQKPPNDKIINYFLSRNIKSNNDE